MHYVPGAPGPPALARPGPRGGPWRPGRWLFPPPSARRILSFPGLNFGHVFGIKFGHLLGTAEAAPEDSFSFTGGSPAGRFWASSWLPLWNKIGPPFWPLFRAPSGQEGRTMDLDRPGPGPAGRELEIERILIRILFKIGPVLAQPAGTSKWREF